MAAIVVGSLLLLPGLAMLLGGAALAAACAFARDDAGFFDTSVDGMASSTAAITAEDLALSAEPGSPDWLLDAFETDVRVRVTSGAEAPAFVGIGPEVDVDAYLAGVAHDEVTDLDGNDAVLSRRDGAAAPGRPGEQDFWVASATGPGTQQLDWEAADGRWAVLLMNADGSPGVRADVDVGLRVDGAVPLAVVLTAVGLVLTALAVGLIVFGASGRRHDAGSAAVPAFPPPPATFVRTLERAHPVSLEAQLDPGLSRWQWLVKWILVVPHAVILVFLWIAFVVATFVAGVSILFTGRYPRRLFDFDVGVLRWTWRVTYYATTGGLGTDVYPPFSLDEEPGYPATLSIEYPEHLSRGLVLVKWLLAFPHHLVVAVLLGGAWAGPWDDGATGAGLLTILVAVAAVVLLVRARYPRPLFDLIVGLNRWIFRVVAYVALLTDEYPPFRLDQGGSEPEPPAPGTGPAGPEATALDLRDPTTPREPVLH